MARPSKSSIKPGSRAQKKDAVKSLKRTGVRVAVNNAKDRDAKKQGHENQFLSKRNISAGESLTNSYGKAAAAGLSKKKTNKAVAKGMKAGDKRMKANEKKASKTGREYTNNKSKASYKAPGPLDW